MGYLIGRAVGWIVVAICGVIAAGLLIAAAVVGFANVVGTGGALAIVGGIFALVALAVILVLQVRKPMVRPTPASGLGGVAAGFLLGMWDGLTKPKRDDPD